MSTAKGLAEYFIQMALTEQAFYTLIKSSEKSWSSATELQAKLTDVFDISGLLFNERATFSSINTSWWSMVYQHKQNLVCNISGRYKSYVCITQA